MNAGRRCHLSHGCHLLSTPFGTLIPLSYVSYVYITFNRKYGLYSKQQKETHIYIYIFYSKFCCYGSKQKISSLLGSSSSESIDQVLGFLIAGSHLNLRNWGNQEPRPQSLEYQTSPLVVILLKAVGYLQWWF